MKQRTLHLTIPWLARYLPPEIASLIAAVVSATLADVLIDNALLLALVSMASASASYYGVLLGRELIHVRQAHRARGIGHQRRAACAAIRGLALDFGGAELLDSLVFSPALLYLCMKTAPNLQLAVALSELVGAIAFYITAALIHTLRKLAAQRVNNARSAADP